MTDQPVAVEQGVELRAAIEIAKTRAWDVYGVKWHYLEEVSRFELVFAALAERARLTTDRSVGVEAIDFLDLTTTAMYEHDGRLNDTKLARRIADDIKAAVLAATTSVPAISEAVQEATVPLYTFDEAWDELVNKDDRTSPEEYPEFCLISHDELRAYMEARELAPTISGEGEKLREAYRRGQEDMQARAAKVCDERGAEEQEAWGLNRAAQNYYRARNAVRDLPILATPDAAPIAERTKHEDDCATLYDDGPDGCTCGAETDAAPIATAADSQEAQS